METRQEMAQEPARGRTMAPDSSARPRFPKFRVGWLEVAFVVFVLTALVLRLWELDGRTMHYDEAIHVHFSWKLFKGEGYFHSPWMHGPFQIELTALVFKLLGDNDHTARLAYVIFGTALAGLPYYLRRHIGGAGALLTGLMLALSPSLLYFSRFGRNDIIMAFWAASILVLMWRYIASGKDRYLVLTAVALALMFSTKETAYLVVGLFGGIAFLLALPDLAPWVLGRLPSRHLQPAARFFLLLITLTLPQWVATAGLFQGIFGLALTNPQGVADGIVGAPQWVEPFVPLPLLEFPVWLHALVGVLLLGFLGRTVLPRWIFAGRPVTSQPILEPATGGSAWEGPQRVTVGTATRSGRAEEMVGVKHSDQGQVSRIGQSERAKTEELLAEVAVPLSGVAAIILVLFRPISVFIGETALTWVDIVLAGGLVACAVAAWLALRLPWERGGRLLLITPMLALAYLALFTPLVDVASIVGTVLPDGISVDASANSIPVNYLVAGALLFGTLLVSVYWGLRWLGGIWLVCAGAFYVIWVTLYTTFFTNLAGIFSGSWLSMGYWIAQQEVARGNQPWYYYFVGMGVYELLPISFGVAAAVYFLRRGDVFGIVLVLWAGLTFLAYTIASEKMPWLLVNITLPFIFLTGKFLGDLAAQISWRDILRGGRIALLVLPPGAIAVLVLQVYRYVQDAGTSLGGPSPEAWALMGVAGLLAVSSAALVRHIRPRTGLALAGLGIAALLLGFGTLGAFRAAYTYDDSNVEILAYAQGSADLPDTYDDLETRVFSGGKGEVRVDYDMWYPFQWYVRNAQEDRLLSFACFKSEGEDGWNTSCKSADEDEDSAALLLTLPHIRPNAESLERFESRGPFRDLIWFPESYRRPNEDRANEGFVWGLRALPNSHQLGLDFQYFGEVAKSRESWADALAYLFTRRLDDEWYKSEYYSYLPKESGVQ